MASMNRLVAGSAAAALIAASAAAQAPDVSTDGTAETATAVAPAAPRPDVVILAPTAPPVPAGMILVPRDTMVRLMVLNEVNTHQAKIGDRFVLRVDENVAVEGVTVISVGSKAWGEVTTLEANGAVGKAGKIGARLLYVERGGDRIPITGEQASKGQKGGDRVVLAVVGFGLLGLLARGSQGKLKAGDIFNGYLAEDLAFDPAAGAFVQLQAHTTAAAQ
jgi:hypothetical protein